MPDPIGDVLGLLGSLAGSYYNYKSVQETNAANTANVNATNAAQLQLAREQNEWNLGMWNRQNAYNDPSAQMSRLKAAGVNPALAYSNGGMMNEAAPAEGAAGAHLTAPQIQAYQVDPLTMAQVRNLNAQSAKTESETEYQNYQNAVEAALAHSPIGQVTVTTDDGGQTTEFVYGNVRVEMTKQEREALGLQNSLTKSQFAALVYDLAVLTGSDSFGYDPYSTAPSEVPNYAAESAALKGDQDVRRIAGELAELSKEAAEAEKAGRKAYAEWIKKNEDKPLVKFALGLQGFLQTFGITIPRMGGSAYPSGRGRSWFFGG